MAKYRMFVETSLELPDDLEPSHETLVLAARAFKRKISNLLPKERTEWGDPLPEDKAIWSLNNDPTDHAVWVVENPQLEKIPESELGGTPV